MIKQFPAIRIALSEGGTGWIPYFLDRLDRTYEMHHLWTGQDFGGRLPSEVFREHFLTCFIADPVGIELRHRIGHRQHGLGVRLPALGLLLAGPAEELAEVAAAVPDEELDKITWENACRWYSFDPFAHRARERCTVGGAAGGGGRATPWRSGPSTRDASSAQAGIDLGELAGAGHGLSRSAGAALRPSGGTARRTLGRASSWGEALPGEPQRRSYSTPAASASHTPALPLPRGVRA